MIKIRPLHPNFTCDVCSREIFGTERVCKPCLDALPWNRGEICICCGRKESQTGLCIECKATRPEFDLARSAFVYDAEAAGLVLRFKRGEKYLAETLTQFLLPVLEEFADADALTFVPMTEKAEKARGYNQSELLAVMLAERSGLELLSGICKLRDTPSQKSLNLKQRRDNLKGCFKITDRKSFRDKKVVLIDDVLTTGATASELAHCMKKAGAARVYVLTVASVPNN